MPCKRCTERVKDWSGDDARCAFETGIFSKDNWNCATMNALRMACDESKIARTDEESAALLPIDGTFILLSWYKNRGHTQSAYFLDVCQENELVPLTVIEAEFYLDSNKP